MNKWFLATAFLSFVFLGAVIAIAVDFSTEAPPTPPIDHEKACSTLMPPASQCNSASQHGDKTCVQGSGGACSWICACANPPSNCAGWIAPYSCSSGTCNGDACSKNLGLPAEAN